MIIDNPLNELRESLTEMANLARDVVGRALAVLESRSDQDLEGVRELDKRVDEFEMRIDKMCMALLMKEPYAIDFRYVFSVAKTIKDLERVGDEGKTIAKWALRLPPEPISADMRALAGKASEALNLAMQALSQRDTAAADAVLHLEFQVDALEDRIIESSRNVAEAFIAKALERIGDLATNIAEEVIFTVQARDIRHGGFKEE